MKWKPMQMPKEVVQDPQTKDAPYFGRFIAEPLEKGYGITLGNALRRVILSSMQGVAITSVRIEGVLHEFSSLEGVYEDVPEIVLNLKGVRFKLIGDNPKPITLDVEKEGEVVAGDIQTPPDIIILNPEHHICTITKKRRLVMEMELEVGKGFSAADERFDSKKPVDTIAVDAIFSPIKRVNFWVEPARVGQRTDYDRLLIEITTDGSITPLEAVTMGAKLLINHLNLFVAPGTEIKEIVEEEVSEEVLRIKNLLMMSVDELELSVRSSNCLRNARIKYLADLVVKTEQEMLKFRNFGRKSLDELRAVLGKLQLRFGMDISKFLSKEELEKLRAMAAAEDEEEKKEKGNAHKKGK